MEFFPSVIYSRGIQLKRCTVNATQMLLISDSTASQPFPQQNHRALNTKAHPPCEIHYFPILAGKQPDCVPVKILFHTLERAMSRTYLSGKFCCFLFTLFYFSFVYTCIYNLNKIPHTSQLKHITALRCFQP